MVADVDFRPHVIVSEVETPASLPTKDSNGDWITPEPGPKRCISVPCHARPNGGQNQIKGVDGVMIDFDFKVFLDHDCPAFLEGQMITIKDGSTVIEKGKVLRFFRGEMNATIWV